MGAIQVKNVPEDLHDELRARAESEGMSISDYVLRLVRRELSFPTTEQWWSLLKAGPVVSASSIDGAAAIRETRDERDKELEERTKDRRGRSRR